MIFELSSIALCALLSVAVSWTRNTFISLIYTVLLFINASVVILSIGYEFLALVNLLVYVGALAVLFLFVIMLLEIPTTALRAYARGLSTLAFLGILACKQMIVPSLRILEWMGLTFLSDIIDDKYTPSGPAIAFVPAIESISDLGVALYVHYSDILILNSMVLTIALLGALVLAHIPR